MHLDHLNATVLNLTTNIVGNHYTAWSPNDQHYVYTDLQQIKSKVVHVLQQTDQFKPSAVLDIETLGLDSTAYPFEASLVFMDSELELSYPITFYFPLEIWGHGDLTIDYNTLGFHFNKTQFKLSPGAIPIVTRYQLEVVAQIFEEALGTGDRLNPVWCLGGETMFDWVVMRHFFEVHLNGLDLNYSQLCNARTLKNLRPELWELHINTAPHTSAADAVQLAQIIRTFQLELGHIKSEVTAKSNQPTTQS